MSEALSTSNVIMFSKPRSVQVIATRKALDKLGIEYEEVDITADPAVVDYLVRIGHLQAPVVIVELQGEEDVSWSGHRPDRIKALPAILAS